MKYNQIYNRPIIFVVGNSRSGTTMLGRILGNNHAVFTFRELHFFEQLWSLHDEKHLLLKKESLNLALKLIRTQKNDYSKKEPMSIQQTEAEKIVDMLCADDLTTLNIFTNFLFYETERNGKKIPCEQTPRYVLFIKEILELYPGAKIINLIRDPRDVLLSQKKKWKRKFFMGAKNFPMKESLRMWANYHPFIISKLWYLSVNAACDYIKSERVFGLRFEDLIENPEKSVSEICHFIGISYDAKMLEVPQVGSSNYINQPDKKGINKAIVGNWKKGGLNSAEIDICQKITSPLMNKYGYVSVDINPNLLTLFFYKISLPLKLLISLCFNLHRMKDIKESVRRRIKWLN